MMERYTEWRDNRGCGLPGKDCYTRLAKYEDTGLEPEEIDSIFINGVIEENRRLEAELGSLRRQMMIGCTEIRTNGALSGKERENLARILAGQDVTLAAYDPHPTETLRPCKGVFWNCGAPIEIAGRFHGWSNNYQEFDAGPGNFTVALVERDDGKIFECDPGTIHFLDRETGERR